MSLVLTVNGIQSIWLLADRRLSLNGRVIRDNARKVMFLETTDGVAILGYAGLGATARGTEPSDWMSAVLRGRHHLTLEQSLGVLARAAMKQLPRHLTRFPHPGIPSHNIIVPAIVGNEFKLFTIDILVTNDRRRYMFRYTRHVVEKTIKTTQRTPRLGLGGSGALCLSKDKKWIRPLLHLVNAYDRGKLTSQAVCDHLASLNYQVHASMADKSVGPNSVVCWRNRKLGIHKGGGGHNFYRGSTRDRNPPSLPTIANGIDLTALIGVMMPHVTSAFRSMREGKESMEMNKKEVDAELTRLPDEPDENLR